MKKLPALLFTLAASFLPLQAAQAAEDVLIVYDASGSMWGQIDGVNKIITAREVLAELVQGWPQDTNLGLVAYGHRSAGDCKDIETLITPQPVDREQFIATVNAINPKGKTPIADSLLHAAEVLKYRDNNATVVLISDGLESCHGDPCAVAAELEQKGMDFTAHVVGFDLDDAGNQALACIADNTGGIFVPAGNAAELKDALQQVQAKVVQKEAAPEPEAEPEPEPEPAAPEYDIEISAPEQVTTGAPFKMAWTDTIATNDYYTIVPAGTEEGKTGSRSLVGDKGEGSLKAPAEPGLYEVRYVLREGMKTLASAPVEVVEAEVGISAPEQVTTGAPFKISWTSTIATNDYYTIVPAGTEEGKTGSRSLVGDKGEGSLKAPAEPGLYEVRYVLREGMKTLASAPVEVVAAEVGISAPDTVRATTAIAIEWTRTIATDDYYTIVPAGTEEGKTGDRSLVGDKGKGTLKAPAEPGLYEVRYVLRQGMKTLASAPVEVVDADATLDSGAGLQAPSQAKPGETITVSWSGGSDARDQRIALALADAADFTWTEAHKIDGNTSQQLTLPDAAGRYEVRYLDVSNTQVLGRAIVEVN
ncbi:MAG: VWA domain-containing protein [Ottowia sp.]|nr:VWA domain-containing protein [Ottowia sp.]